MRTLVGNQGQSSCRIVEAEKEASNEMDTDDSDSNESTVKGSYWYRKFGAEERDATRCSISKSELNDTVFSAMFWFKAKSYPPHIKKDKKVFLSGLDGDSLSDNLIFQPSGKVTGLPERFTKGDFYDMNMKGTIINFGMSLEHGTHPIISLYVHRRNDWGWELRSNLYAIRSLSDGGDDDIEELWKDYTSCLVVQKRKKGTPITRLPYKYARREVPDIEELKDFLLW